MMPYRDILKSDTFHDANYIAVIASVFLILCLLYGDLLYSFSGFGLKKQEVTVENLYDYRLYRGQKEEFNKEMFESMVNNSNHGFNVKIDLYDQQLEIYKRMLGKLDKNIELQMLLSVIGILLMLKKSESVSFLGMQVPKKYFISSSPWGYFIFGCNSDFYLMTSSASDYTYLNS